MKTNEQELKGAFPLVHENGDLTETGKKFIKQFTAYKTAVVVMGSIFGIAAIAFGIAVVRRIRASRNVVVVEERSSNGPTLNGADQTWRQNFA